MQKIPPPGSDPNDPNGKNIPCEEPIEQPVDETEDEGLDIAG